jgi:hypothetical protein
LRLAKLHVSRVVRVQPPRTSTVPLRLPHPWPSFLPFDNLESVLVCATASSASLVKHRCRFYDGSRVVTAVRLFVHGPRSGQRGRPASEAVVDTPSGIAARHLHTAEHHSSAVYLHQTISRIDSYAHSSFIVYY